MKQHPYKPLWAAAPAAVLAAALVLAEAGWWYWSAQTVPVRRLASLNACEFPHVKRHVASTGGLLRRGELREIEGYCVGSPDAHRPAMPEPQWMGQMRAEIDALQAELSQEQSR